MTAKETLRERVEEMTEDEASDLLDFLALQDDPDELGEADIEQILEARLARTRGDVMTSAEVKTRYGL